MVSVHDMFALKGNRRTLRAFMLGLSGLALHAVNTAVTVFLLHHDCMANSTWLHSFTEFSGPQLPLPEFVATSFILFHFISFYLLKDPLQGIT